MNLLLLVVASISIMFVVNISSYRKIFVHSQKFTSRHQSLRHFLKTTERNERSIALSSKWKVSSILHKIVHLISIATALTTSSAAISKAADSGVDSNGLFDICDSDGSSSSCISSQDDRPAFFQAPWCYDGNITVTRRKLLEKILTISKSRIVPGITNSYDDVAVVNDRLVRAEFSTMSLLGDHIVDEVQFYFTPNDNTIQFRSVRNSIRSGSGSGSGYFGYLLPDFGEGRRRLEDIRVSLGLEEVPVLRNRRRVLFFVESPFDTFGPPTIQFERLVDTISGDMDEKAAEGSLSGELDPARPLWETVTKRRPFHNSMTKQNINDIPVSVFVLIFTHFTANEILPLILACKTWERILYSEEYWFAMCEHKMKATISSGRPETGLRTILSQMNPPRYLSTVISQLGLSSYRSLFPIFLTELLTGYESATLFTATPPRALVIEQPPVGSDQIPSVLWCWASTYYWSYLERNVLFNNSTKKSIESIISYEQSTRAAAVSTDLVSVFTTPLLWLRVSFLFASRFDQGTVFRLKINPIGTTNRDNFDGDNWIEHHNPAGVEWRRFTKHYPITFLMQGVSFNWAGKDESFWAGHYGAKVANISIAFATYDEITSNPFGAAISMA